MKLLLFLATAALAAVLSSPAHAAEGPVRHVVAFKFKEGADPAKIKAVEVAFAALKGKIPLIQTLEWGTDISPEKKAKGFTHMWIATFKNTADRDAYLVHPDHLAFVGGLKEVMDDAFVFDFIPQE